MHSFFDFFSLGFTKLAYLDVFGHVLFIIALCGIYTVPSWKYVAGYVGSFIAAFLITFFLSSFDIVTLPDKLLSYLIPITVFLTACTNFLHKKKPFINKYPNQNYRYFIGFAGGLLHGLYFPRVVKVFLISPDDLVTQVIAFNMGVVLGLLLIVFFLLVINFIVTYFIRVNIREWNLLISGACAGIALYIIADLLSK